MRRRVLIVALLLGVGFMPSPAAAERLVTTISRHQVLVTSNFTGTSIVHVPSYLAVLSNRPLEAITDLDIRKRMQIGLDNILLPQRIDGTAVEAPPDDIFRSSFVRLKMDHRLYLQAENGVTLLTPTVFRAAITLPAEAPVGNYDVDIKGFANSTMVARATSAFEVVKVGFEQFVVTAARDYGLFYGIATAMMAVFTGWFASVVFRRD